MAIRDGDFYIQKSNQDFWLREAGVWVRKGNIRDEGSQGLVGIQPIIGVGFTLGVQVDRIRFLGSIADDLGINMAALVSRIRLLAATHQYGAAMSVIVDRIRQVAPAGEAMGYNMSVIVDVLPTLILDLTPDPMSLGFLQSTALSRIRELSAANDYGFSIAAAVTRTRYLGSVTDAMGFNQAATLDRIKALAATSALGFNMAASVDRLKAIAAAMAEGFSLAAAVTRTRQLTASMAEGFSTAVVLTHANTQAGYLITAGVNLTTSNAYFKMYDGSYTAVTAPVGVPTGAATIGCVAVSHDKTKFAINTATDVIIISLTTGLATIHTISGILSGNNGTLSWSPDDSRLLIVNNGLVAIYNTSTWTTVTAPTVASSAALAGDWSPGTGTRIAIICNLTPFVREFDTSTMAGVTNPASQPGSAPASPSIRYSPNGTYLLAAGTTVLFVYDRTNSMTKLADPATLPSGGAGGRRCSINWKSDDSRFTIGTNGTPRLWSYTISGTTITKEADASTLPGSNSTGAKFMESATHCVALSNTAPKLLKYTVSAGSWAKDTDIVTQPGTNDLVVDIDASF